METAITLNTIVQVAANCVGFLLFFMLLKSQVKKRDDAFDKTVEIVNHILQRLTKVETIQENQEDDIKEVREKVFQVKYKP